MKLQFDKNQGYQLDAIQSVVDLFEGQSLNKSDFEFSLSDSVKGSIQFTEAGVGNNLVLSEEQILANLVKVQTGNQLRPDEISIVIEKLWYNDDAETKNVVATKTVVTDFPNFSVEMETGTGKTYVYLRSVYELNKIYGFKKFVIVVPSVAIREGVLKSLQITFDHLQEIYENQPAEYKVYDSGRIPDLANFAKSNAIQILVINIDSFTKDANVINQVRETGVRPIEYIQKSNPIVIIDEPQNMETDIRKRAIANLHPLFTLRYSATHKNLYNLVYKLDPVKAYDLGLVKQIEVDSVIAKNDISGAFISVDDFKIAKQSITAKITIFVNEKGGVQKKQVTAKIGDDLFNISKGWGIYKEGYVINELDADNGFIEFSSGKIVYKGQAVGGLTDQILKEMIDATVENHFKKEKELRAKGIKVLSIFFIDRVANYRSYDEQGKSIKGKFALWFEDSFTKWQNMPAYRGLFTYSSDEVHNGYFSQDKGKLKDSKEGKTTKADDETFKLIMQDKERLLDTATPLRFIFSHSALREGWDNPNVFQICTLNETKSDIKKRQEIGRGLRLCVDQTGVRNLDRAVNRLTVIANEAYDSFSKALQNEIEEDCGVKFEGRIKNARARAKVSLKDKWLEDSLFLTLWDKIKYRTDYKVQYSTQQLIDNCVAALQLMSPIERPIIYREKNIAKFIRDNKGNLIELGGEQKGSKERLIREAKFDIPDFIAYIQSKTELTRNTISRILLESGRVGEIFNNPQLFMDSVVKIVKQEFDNVKINGIKYEKIAGQVYEMKLFESAEIEQYLENLITVKSQAKTLYNYIAIDSLSTPEKKFAEDCDSRDDIIFYVKLPKTFQIKTPIGPYNPDWALIKKDEGDETNIYFVAETKDPKAVLDRTLLRDSERKKIACAEKHFAVIEDVHYKVVGSVSDLKI
ncbi:restriction endonuclease [Mucilaginibacter boryungensis]|uniref:DEAD/DEAH box helicase family protein n=1 Tax=Mucilaginibacter boryungensis TaxID=768480 RepID=A0ABR9XL48_9SPHI|nr:DEAD/DEAH box helicase family protein [Mucilaginibacter boryungensis]MBE9668088.1 DEAD/DEAH box helicase family protein [Mucilaginibacter boryungensis]